MVVIVLHIYVVIQVIGPEVVAIGRFVYPLHSMQGNETRYTEATEAEEREEKGYRWIKMEAKEGI